MGAVSAIEYRMALQIIEVRNVEIDRLFDLLRVRDCEILKQTQKTSRCMEMIHEYEEMYDTEKAKNSALSAIIKTQAQDLECIRQEAYGLALQLRDAVDYAKAMEGRQ